MPHFTFDLHGFAYDDDFLLFAFCFITSIAHSVTSGAGKEGIELSDGYVCVTAHARNS